MSDRPEDSKRTQPEQPPAAEESARSPDAAPQTKLSSNWFGTPSDFRPASTGTSNRLLPSWLSGIAATDSPAQTDSPQPATAEESLRRAPVENVAPREEGREVEQRAIAQHQERQTSSAHDTKVPFALEFRFQPLPLNLGAPAPSPASVAGPQPLPTPAAPIAPAAQTAKPSAPASPAESPPPHAAVPAPIPTSPAVPEVWRTPSSRLHPHGAASSPGNATLSAPQDAVTPRPSAVTHRRFLKGVVITAIAVSTAGAALVLSRGSEAPTPVTVVDPSGDASQNRPAPVNPEGRVMPAGSFTMGSPESEAGRNDDEGAVGVTLTHPFWSGTHEVTQGIWSEVMRSNPSYFSACGAECPVERISWFDSAEFMNRLSARAGLTPCYSLGDCSGTAGSGTVVGEQAPVWGRGDFECASAELVTSCSGYRFPTEAEWEFAARANTTGATYVGALEVVGKRNAPNLGKIAWYAGNSVVDYNPAFDCSAWKARELSGPRCGPKPVGLRTPNPNQLQDVLGNVWEWTSDWYKKDRSVAGVGLVDPQGPQSGEIRVFKGGSWRDSAVHSRSAARRGSRPQWRYASLGLRLARNQP